MRFTAIYCLILAGTFSVKAQTPVKEKAPEVCAAWTSNLVGKIVCNTIKTTKSKTDDRVFTTSVVTAEPYVYDGINAKVYTEIGFDFTWYGLSDNQLHELKASVDKLREDPEREQAYANYICLETFADKTAVLKKITLAEDTRLILWGIPESIVIPKNSTVHFRILAQGEMTIQGAYNRVDFVQFGEDFEHPRLGKFKKGDIAEVKFPSPWPIEVRVSSGVGISSPWEKY